MRGGGASQQPAPTPEMKIQSEPHVHVLSVFLPRSISPEMVTISANKGDRLRVVADAWHMEDECHFEWQISFPPYDVDIAKVQAKFDPDGRLTIAVTRRPKGAVAMMGMGMGMGRRVGDEGGDQIKVNMVEGWWVWMPGGLSKNGPEPHTRPSVSIPDTRFRHEDEGVERREGCEREKTKLNPAPATRASQEASATIYLGVLRRVPSA
ncbi:hypothetical protein NLJ89_g1030 [Agrocybe chaxingu]|uniref:SHSP domain-containing protein n=1 Tax=Agrocybe chaxingu TaxID=84603 RepID=A0A9W8TFU4_9AGAR|nr:hypothetical protein NLJ89_g1030 [Agrocybe chaxingu]